jgi:large subunit ribosomal protein L25
VSGLEINNSIHLNDVELPKGVKPASSRSITIASITGRQKEEEPVAGAETAPAAGAVPASTAKAPAEGAAAPAAGAAAAKPAGKK